MLADKLNPLSIESDNIKLKILPMSYKLNKTNLIMKYNIFSGTLNHINIYKDNYSITYDEISLTINIDIKKGIDSNKNEVLFYNLSTIIPLKFNSNFLDDNIFNLCNFLMKKELSSL